MSVKWSELDIPKGLVLLTQGGRVGVFGVSAFVTLRQPVAKERFFLAGLA